MPIKVRKCRPAAAGALNSLPASALLISYTTQKDLTPELYECCLLIAFFCVHYD
jgi:hypothetical protein